MHAIIYKLDKQQGPTAQHIQYRIPLMEKNMEKNKYIIKMYTT